MTWKLRLFAVLLAAAVIPACSGDRDSTSTPGTVSGSAIGLSGNILVLFSPTSPGMTTGLVPVTGLPAGYNLVDIDYRPANGELQGVAVSGTSAQLVSIVPNTGVATPVGGPVTGLTPSTRWGVDFNPTVDRLRVVNAADESLRVNPSSGLRADLPTNDTDLSPASRLISSVAYSNNFSGAGTTTLYGIAAGDSSLYMVGGVGGNPSPNLGAMTLVAPLGVTLDGGSDVGFDISSSGTAYATLQVGGMTRIYTINLTSGAATAIGPVGSGSLAIQGLTIVP